MPKTDPLIPRDMAKAILEWQAEGAKILQAFITEVEAKKPPPLLYHYTNDAGLSGIIKSGQLWFSDIFALNDPSELRHGLSVAIDILKSRITGARPEIGTFASQFERFDLDAGVEMAGHFFICVSAETVTISASGEPMPTTDKVLPSDSTAGLWRMVSRRKKANRSGSIRPFRSHTTTMN